ncbi:MAG: magnesium transporter CorA family protein [Chloroflexi bacterium]|nr:magnesium transporter CorA family protein [Chloroflexota bacterium]MCY3583623.1 magnesium transporter CorA family protein [Chloroflexota bacterium]MCY3716587.1 magnesium transporter CorA family protein [Chloroflexota bacterium]MDE2651278.1 magnesium transporter CorA family protein [Chloroflexota bacterium]MYC55348.1 magnesium transporter CorA family protein [Chloroflexota bacterium]
MPTQTLQHSSTTWLDIVAPSAADVAALQARFPQFHPLNLEDIRSRIERPKLDQDDDYLFLVMHFPQWDSQGEVSRASEVDFFVGRDFVVTVHNGTLKPLMTTFQRCQSDDEARAELLSRGGTFAFYTLLDQLVDYIFPIMGKVDRRVAAIGDALFESNAKRTIRELALLRRDIISLRRIIRAQIPIAQQLESVQHPILHEDMADYFGDVADHLFKLRDIADENFEVINSFAEAADTLASYRINEVMRILTVISVIMLPLTLISSIYGMNIDLPLADDPNAFMLTAVIMILVALLMLLIFRLRHWL